jgi:hypothetical protein
LIDIIQQAIVALVQTFNLIRCSNIVPIYQTSVYAASCEYSMLALIWFFSASTIMATFGFFMIMFRSALLDTQYTYTYDTSYGRSNNHQSAFHDENDFNNDDGQTRAGYTTGGNDTVMNSLVNYEKNHLNN